ncbi:MAG: recombinase family protein [Oscillospiraceae bacterium]|nr:recombinase family protein [Oscillospiraceae bacterium]
MTDVAIYIRLSEEDREKKENDSESIINQRNMLTEYASERGWDIYEIYSDEDYSGSDATRPAFNKMIADAKDGKFKVILCKSLSRFARDVSMVETYINGYFIEWGIRFISLADYADSSQKGSRKNIQINSLVNQWYLEDLSENIRSVMTHKKKQGQFTGAFAPYGYIKDPQDNHRLIADPDAAAVVKRIFQLYLAGYGNKAIANALNNDGVPCPSKYRKTKGFKSNRNNVAVEELRWSDHSVWHILRNPNYTGDLVQGRYGKPTYKSKSIKEKTPGEWIVVDGVHEAIVSKADYDRVQATKASRGLNNRNASVNRAVANIFAGTVKCKICGRSLVLSGSGKINKGTRYLRCAGRKSGISSCKCAMVKYDLLAGEVTEKIQEIIQRYCDFGRLEKHTRKSRDFNSEAAALKKSKDKNLFEQKKIDDALSDSYVDKSSGVITGEEFSVISARLKVKKEELVKEYSYIQAQLDKLFSLQDAESKVNQMIAQYQNFTELNREIVNAFVDVIYIGERDQQTKDFDLEIHWRL